MHQPELIPTTPRSAFRLFMAVTLVLALGVSCLAALPPAQNAAAASADQVKLVRDDTWIEYDSYRTASMHDAETGYQIICAQPAKDSPESDTYTKDYEGIDEHIEATGASSTWIEIRSFLVRALMYYTHPDSPGFDTSLFPEKNWEGDDWTRNDYIAMLHLSLSTAYDNSYNAATVGTGKEFRSWAIENVTGGFAAHDDVGGKQVFFEESIWGKLLNYDGGNNVIGWNSDSNPYYAELPEGFKIFIVHPGGADQVCFGFDAFGWISLEKKSTVENITNGNRVYGLEGAEYGIYSDSACTKLVEKLTIGKNGTAKSGALAPKTYYVKELSAPYGFTLDVGVRSIRVKACKTIDVVSKETPMYATPKLLVQKTNAETGNAAAVAGSTLQGAKFAISYYDSFEDFDTPARTWTFMSDERGEVTLDAEHFVEGDAFFHDAAGAPAFPLGHYTVKEIAAPEGYHLNDDVQSFDLRDSGTERPVISFSHETTVPDHVFRGDFEFRKIDDKQNGLANIPFLVSYDNGEQGALRENHVIVTDVNGSFSSNGVSHSANTNANDKAVELSAEGSYLVDEEKLDPSAGIWFSMDKSGACAPVNDEVGALPYGTYRLEELPCTANEGRTLVSTIFTVGKDGTCIKLGNIVDSSPELSTTAYDRKDGDKLLSPTGTATVVDTVRYANLTPGNTYKLTGTVMMASTGEPLADDEGNPLSVSQDLSATQPYGTLTMKFTFDASKLAGEKLIVFEKLELNGKTVASHESLDDADQTVAVLPKIGTSAADKADGDSYITSTEATIVDTVSYEGLQPGKAYKLDALLMDKTTGNVARDAAGDALSASREFTPETSDGSVAIEISLDTTVVGGHDVVVFEKLLDETDTVLATHQDLEDEQQTLKTVGLDTKAWDKADKDEHYAAEAELVTIVDEVSYVNLEPGCEYVLDTTLVDKATGEPAEENGSALTSSQTFTPEKANGIIQAEISFDPTVQPATELVVFESLKYGGNEVAAHTDLEDEDQTVTAVVPTPVPETESGTPLGTDAVGTGDDANLLWVALGTIAITAACAAGAGLYRRKLACSRANRDDADSQD